MSRGRCEQRKGRRSRSPTDSEASDGLTGKTSFICFRRFEMFLRDAMRRERKKERKKERKTKSFYSLTRYLASPSASSKARTSTTSSPECRYGRQASTTSVHTDFDLVLQRKSEVPTQRANWNSSALNFTFSNSPPFFTQAARTTGRTARCLHSYGNVSEFSNTSLHIAEA